MAPKLTRRTVLEAAGVTAGTVILGTTPVNAASEPDQDWPQFCYDGRNSGGSNEITGPREPVEVEWSEELPDRSQWAPIVGDGYVVATADGEMSVYDGEFGVRQWSDDGITTAPAFDGRRLIISKDDQLLGFEIDSGRERWSQDLNVDIEQPLTVDDGTVYAGGHDGLLARSSSTGVERWRTDRFVLTSPAATSDAVIYDGTIAGGALDIVFPDRSQSELEATSWPDRTRTHHELNGGSLLETDIELWLEHADPTIVDGKMYLAGAWIIQVDIDTGVVDWIFDGESFQQPFDDPSYGDEFLVPGSPAVVDSHLYFGTGTALEDSLPEHEATAGVFYAVDVANQTVEWTFETEAPIDTAPAVTAETVYFANTAGNLYAVDRESGEQLWSITVGAHPTSPAISGEWVYVSSDENGLLALTTPEEQQAGGSTDAGQETATANNEEDDDGGDGTTDETADGDSNDDGFGPGFGLGSAIAGLGASGYLLKKRLESRTNSE